MNPLIDLRQDLSVSHIPLDRAKQRLIGPGLMHGFFEQCHHQIEGLGVICMGVLAQKHRPLISGW
jgi:hypothetical protein